MDIEKITGTLVYSEFDQKKGPVARAWFPDITEEELKKVAMNSMPQLGQMGEITEQGINLFQLDDTKVCISYYQYLSGSVRTLTGARLASISFVTEQTISPFQLKPFLEHLIKPLYRIVVNKDVIKQVWEELNKNKDKRVKIEIKDKMPIRIKVRIPRDDEIPETVWELNELSRELGK